MTGALRPYMEGPLLMSFAFRKTASTIIAGLLAVSGAFISSPAYAAAPVPPSVAFSPTSITADDTSTLTTSLNDATGALAAVYGDGTLIDCDPATPGSIALTWQGWRAQYGAVSELIVAWYDAALPECPAALDEDAVIAYDILTLEPSAPSVTFTPITIGTGDSTIATVDVDGYSPAPTEAEYADGVLTACQVGYANSTATLSYANLSASYPGKSQLVVELLDPVAFPACPAAPVGTAGGALASATLKFSAVPIAPSAPRNLTVALAQYDRIAYTWDVPSDPGTGTITNYRIYLNGALVTEHNDLNDLSWIQGGLTAGVEYTIGVSAVSEDGESDLTTLKVTTPTPAMTVLDTTGIVDAAFDRALIVTVAGVSESRVGGTPDVAGLPDGMTLTQVCSDGDCQWIAGGTPTALGVFSVTLTVWFDVDSTAWSLTDTFTIKINPAPPAPSGPKTVIVSETGTDSILLSWPADPDATQYDIYMDGYMVGTVSSYELSFLVQGLTPGTKYSFIIVGVNDVGQSSGVEIEATTLTEPSDEELAYTGDDVMVPLSAGITLFGLGFLLLIGARRIRRS